MGYEKTSWHSGEVSRQYSNVLCLLWRRDISRWTSFYFHHGITLQALSGYYDLVAFFWWYVCIGPKANKSWELLGVKKYMNGILENCIPYVPPSSAHFQIGIWSPKRQLFDWQFCVGLCQTIWKQWAKGFCEILKFWPLHSVRQNIAGFRRGLFTCFLGHTPYTKVWPKKQVIL